VPQVDFDDVVAVLASSTCYDLLRHNKSVPNYDDHPQINLSIVRNDGEKHDD
jgi:hypothetical protein